MAACDQEIHAKARWNRPVQISIGYITVGGTGNGKSLGYWESCLWVGSASGRSYYGKIWTSKGMQGK